MLNDCHWFCAWSMSMRYYAIRTFSSRLSYNFGRRSNRNGLLLSAELPCSLTSDNNGVWRGFFRKSLKRLSQLHNLEWLPRISVSLLGRQCVSVAYGYGVKVPSVRFIFHCVQQHNNTNKRKAELNGKYHYTNGIRHIRILWNGVIDTLTTSVID